MTQEQTTDDVDEVDDDECDGWCITRPHRFTYGGGRFSSPVCQRNGCGTYGTGDRCGDGECEGDLDPDEMRAALTAREE